MSASTTPPPDHDPFGPAPTPLPRRAFLQRAVLGALAIAGSNALTDPGRLFAAARAPLGPGTPEIPNDEVARIFRERFGNRPITRAHVQLDMPAVAEDGRVVPVIIESDIPMMPERYVKGVHLIVDHNPDPDLAAFYLTPVVGRVSLSTRIKMKRTTWVRAILETNTGELWADYAHVLVTLNGCG
ncbi:MAG TPA: thiosulfate oxidation carrier protein SoxY [Gemmatimonadales bacterium]|nr:thiosulfate oxidation carrier protein SoxY [Gemmatimonadales bacterium]